MVASNTGVKFCCFVGVSFSFVGVNLGLNSSPYLESGWNLISSVQFNLAIKLVC